MARKHYGLTNLIFSLGILACGLIYGDEPKVKINGFASAGSVMGDLDAEFMSGTDIIGESALFGADNTIGLQIFSDINREISLTGQLLAKGVIDSYNLEAHWAYVDYHPNLNFAIRAGRLVLPIMMSSEYVDVGYAYPWVRLPSEIYSGIPITAHSGVEVVYTVNLGESNLVVQPWAGSLPSLTMIGMEVSGDSSVGLNISLQFEYGSIRSHVMRLGGFSSSDTSSGFSFEMDAQVIAIGADLEMANVVFISEYMKREFRLEGIDLFPAIRGEAWYVTLGYRMGKFLPHITLARGDSDVEQAPALEVAFTQMLASNPNLATVFNSMNVLQQQAFREAFAADPVVLLSNPDVQAMLQAADVTMDPSQLQALSALAGSQMPGPPLAYKQKSITLGLRYDILPRTAVKLEYQEIEPQDESWGLFRQEPKDKVHLMSFAIDVIF